MLVTLIPLALFYKYPEEHETPALRQTQKSAKPAVDFRPFQMLTTYQEGSTEYEEYTMGGFIEE